MKCPKCNYENKEDALYCGLCYEVLKKKEYENKNIDLKKETQISSKSNKSKLWLLCILTGIFLVVAIRNWPDIVFVVKVKVLGIKVFGIHQGIIETSNMVNIELNYLYYVPESKDEKMPVLVCVPGLDGDGTPFMEGYWKDFADNNKFVILSPFFRFDIRDWNNHSSYQYPEVWSGKALLDILNNMEDKVPILKDNLYLFGFSAGAQFCHKFAILKPDICKAVAFHSPGGIELPDKWIPVKFLITVGSKDNDETDRIGKAKKFFNRCKDLNISIKYKEYSKLGHEFNLIQVFDSLDYFDKVKQSMLVN